MAIIDVQHRFFLPKWRRVATVAFCGGWALVELNNGAVFWVIIFGGLGAFCFYEFFFAFDPDGKLQREAEKDTE